MSKDFENNNNDKRRNDFGLPDGYFQKSAASISNKIEWQEEHKPYFHLSRIKNHFGANACFTVPENYFENSELRSELLPYPALLKQKRSGAGFTVPEAYFEEHEISLPGKLIYEDDDELLNFKTLNSVQKQNPFLVPENYFSGSEIKIRSVIGKAPAQAKVLRLSRARIWYSAAAAIVAITLGLWLYSRYFRVTESGDCNTLACLDKADLIKAKTQLLENIDEEDLYKMVDAEKLEEHLKEKINTETIEDKNDSLKDSDAEELIEYVY